MAADIRPRFVEGLSAFADDYDLFLLDQFGVLHDGLAPYPGVAEALAELRARDKRVGVITNSGRTAEENKARIARIGIDPDALDAVVTSGDAAIAWLVAEALDRPCFPICTGGNVTPLEEAGARLVDSIAEAELIFLGGMPGSSDDIEMADFEPWIAEGLRRGLPMVCANRDKVGTLGDRVVLSPGAIAEAYARRGGETLLFGKPDPSIYRYALDLFEGADPARTVMIGDMPETDLVGANSVGIDGGWVLCGVYAAKVDAGATDATGGRDARLARARAVLEREGAEAAWILPSLRW